MRGHGGRIARLQPCRPARPRAANGVRVGAAAAARWQLHRALLVAGWSALCGRHAMHPPQQPAVPASFFESRRFYSWLSRPRETPSPTTSRREVALPLDNALGLRSETRQIKQERITGSRLDQTRCIPGYARCERVWAGARRLHELHVALESRLEGVTLTAHSHRPF